MNDEPNKRITLIGVIPGNAVTFDYGIMDRMLEDANRTAAEAERVRLQAIVDAERETKRLAGMRKASAARRLARALHAVFRGRGR